MKIKTITTMKKHILTWYNKASEQELKAGKDWYLEAHNIAVNKAGIESVYQMSQVISIMSPQVSWQQNVINANRIYNCYMANNDVLDLQMFATQLQKVHAYEALAGNYYIPERALKTFNFANNISTPSDDRYITIDRHATKIALNDLSAGGVQLSKNNYLDVSAAYKAVAKKLEILPCQLQAITWLTYKRIVNR